MVAGHLNTDTQVGTVVAVIIVVVEEVQKVGEVGVAVEDHVDRCRSMNLKPYYHPNVRMTPQYTHDQIHHMSHLRVCHTGQKRRIVLPLTMVAVVTTKKRRVQEVRN